MPVRPSSPVKRPRSPPRPRSPTTTTFQIRGLPSSSTAHEAGFVTLSGSEYDRLVQAHPNAVLCYIDEEDEEVIRVGSGHELHARWLEVMGFPPPPPPIIFNVEGGPAGLQHWQPIFQRSQPEAVVRPAELVSIPSIPGQTIVIDESEEEESLYAPPPKKKTVLDAPQETPFAESAKDLEPVVCEQQTLEPTVVVPINTLPTGFAEEPFVASFEAEVNRILEEVVSHAGGSPRCLSPRSLSPRPPSSHPLLERTEQPESSSGHDTRNPVDLISDVFNSVIQSIQRVAQEATSQAARAFPQGSDGAAEESAEHVSAAEKLETFNSAVQQLLKTFTDQLHALATEAVQSAGNPQANPQHPAAVLRTFAESVGHAAVQNAGRIREELRDVRDDASAEAWRAAEEIKKAAEEVKKAAQIVTREVGKTSLVIADGAGREVGKAAQMVTREVGKTGAVLGNVAGGAGREVGKVFSDGVGAVTGFAGDLVRNLSGQSHSPPTESGPMGGLEVVPGFEDIARDIKDSDDAQAVLPETLRPVPAPHTRPPMQPPSPPPPPPHGWHPIPPPPPPPPHVPHIAPPPHPHLPHPPPPPPPHHHYHHPHHPQHVTNTRTAMLDDDPIEKCVKSLIEIGYTEMGTDRLRVFAELSGGDVDGAVDMVEEERRIWQTFTN